MVVPVFCNRTLTPNVDQLIFSFFISFEERLSTYLGSGFKHANETYTVIDDLSQC